MTKKNLLIPLLVMVLWGSLFPFVKIGYKTMAIDTSSVFDILCFAGLRFLACGLIITAIALFRGEHIGGKKTVSIAWILLTGLFSTVLHYACTYVGLSLIESSKTAILKQLGSLIYICTSFLFIKEEKFSFTKIIGGIVGFTGVAVINLGDGKIVISLGSILIIGASFCTVFSNLASKRAMKNTDSMLVTGISQLFGGLVLFLIGICNNSALPTFTPIGTAVFAYICLASIIGYCLWFETIKKANLSGMFIIKFSEPIFAMLFGYILLREDIFKIQYLASFVLVILGIFIASIRKKSTDE